MWMNDVAEQCGYNDVDITMWIGVRHLHAVRAELVAAEFQDAQIRTRRQVPARAIVDR